MFLGAEKLSFSLVTATTHNFPIILIVLNAETSAVSQKFSISVHNLSPGKSHKYVSWQLVSLTCNISFFKIWLCTHQFKLDQRLHLDQRGVAEPSRTPSVELPVWIPTYEYATRTEESRSSHFALIWSSLFLRGVGNPLQAVEKIAFEASCNPLSNW